MTTSNPRMPLLVTWVVLLLRPDGELHQSQARKRHSREVDGHASPEFRARADNMKSTIVNELGSAKRPGPTAVHRH